MKVYSNPESYSGADTVVTLGMFDGVHAGHKKLLSHVMDVSKEESLTPTVLTFWPHPRMVLKKNEDSLQFITTLDEKTVIISQQGIEQLFLLPFNKELASKTAEEFIVEILIKKIKMKHLVVGYNHRFGRDRVHDYTVYQQLAKKYNFTISRVDAVYEGDVAVSSTAVRNLLNEGRVLEANRILGYDYSIFGTVTGGKKLGRKLGYPTANIKPNEHYKLIPGKGVYACLVNVIGKQYGGMLNVGVRPTVNSNEFELTIEVHILDFNQDIYSEEVTVSFIEKVREEQKFDGLEALVQQLKNDELNIRKLLRDYIG